ncbi:MAG: ABC transporter permease [Terriglobales bacterium]
MAVAFLLLVSFGRLAAAPTGYSPKDIIVASLTLPTTGPLRRTPWGEYASAALTRLRAIPGVGSATVALSAPGQYQLHVSYAVNGGKPTSMSPTAGLRVVGPGYFQLLKIPILRGRGFTSADSAVAAAVCIVSANLAAARFGHAPAVGRTIKPAGLRACRIVGKVADVAANGLGSPPEPTVYMPFAQFPARDVQSFLAFLVKSRLPARALRAPVTAAVQTGLPVPVSITTQEALLARGAALSRMRGPLVAVLAIPAVLLAMAALGGMLFAGLASRKGELGIRVALGASRRIVAAGVLAEGLATTAAGAVIGLVLAAAGGSALRELLFGVSPWNPWIYASVLLLMTGIAFAASLPAAIQAAALSPMEALRQN